ncbi:hypothetical protein, partial [Kosakonia cowanii]|uniref:hypothetical protein n=1 Tax=Kosakonia cowanii TaxID=208223 RepID=UPI0039B101D2
MPFRNRFWSRRRGLTALLAAGALAAGVLPGQSMATDLRPIVPVIKRSVVGIGTFERTRSPSTVFNGIGFVVGDGLDVIT